MAGTGIAIATGTGTATAAIAVGEAVGTRTAADSRRLGDDTEVAAPILWAGQSPHLVPLLSHLALAFGTTPMIWSGRLSCTREFESRGVLTIMGWDAS